MMRTMTKGLMSVALLAAGMTVASAQSYPYGDGRYRDDRPVREGDRYSEGYGQQPYGPQGYGNYRQAFYDRLQSDLERAASSGYLRGGDFRRFQKARHEINEFQAKWSRGRFDPRELDDAIGATQRVANIPGLYERDRAALLQDLDMMRRFRARMTGNAYGYRGGPGADYRPY